MDFPILNWQRFASGSDPDGFVRDLSEACRKTGFFLLTGHGVSEALISDVFAKGDAFFALPHEVKSAFDIRDNPYDRGWACEGSESLDETSGLMDRKEAFNIGLELSPDDPRVLAKEPFRGVNTWPEIDGFRDTMLRYYDAVWDLSVALHRAFERDLGLPKGYFDPHFTAPLATLRVLSYPASEDGAGIGAGAHTDYGSVTMLLTDGVGGLQVRPRNKSLGKDWVDVPHVPGAFVVNIGDCMMRWTNDIYISTPHRVLPPKAPRRSIAFFLDPNPESVIAALPGTGEAKYPAVTGADYLRSRLDATYTPKEVQ
nr:2-oxoglutarate and iron-dependent oxygenase domain-containing protein [uncultured Celeribacter sp.]